MKKYILYTSIFWLCVLGLALSFLLYKPRLSRNKPVVHNGPQPVAQGPAATAENMGVKPGQSLETPGAALQLTPEGMQNIGVKTGVVEQKEISDDIRATGTVDIDERQVSYVQTRFRGYVRKVFANASYQAVRKGEPLFTIYSPELVATEQDYLNGLEDEKRLGTSSVEGVASGAKELAKASENRLLQWEMTANDMARLKERGELVRDISIDSPVSGYVTERNALPNLYVEPGTRLYTIADLSRVWVYAQVFQDDVGRVKPGDTARITVDAYPGRVFKSRIESILPQVDQATRTVRVRLAVANGGMALKPGMYVNADLRANLGKQLVIPVSAVIQGGTRQVVFLSEGNGRMERHEVVLGPRVGEEFVVVSGLRAGQQIVTSANFLIDSESQLEAAAGSYTAGSEGGGDTATTPSNTAQGRIDFTTTPGTPHKGRNGLHARLLGPGGAVIDGAEVTVMFFMPAMPAMGMAAMKTAVTLTGKGNGVYEGSVVLESGGSWQVAIMARKDGNNVAAKQLRLNAEGGM